ncbi:MAG: hypothetical protein ACE15B_06395 [Bryobacteraceae bacterium]
MSGRIRQSGAALALVATLSAWGAPFDQQVRRFYGAADGLPSEDVSAIAASGGEVYAATPRGLARFSGGKWSVVLARPVSLAGLYNGRVLAVSEGWLYIDGRRTVEAPAGARALSGRLFATDTGVFALDGGRLERLGDLTAVRGVAESAGGEIVAAAESGLYRYAGGAWRPLYPEQGNRRWAPRDVRAVAFDSRGRLWFAAPQGAGVFDGQWRLFTGADGLPYDDFTALAASDSAWFGTTRGALRFDGRTWEFRQGLRWLPADGVRGVALTADGDAWFATAHGAGCIWNRRMTFPEKARFFEDEIDARHRRTPYGYVLAVTVKRPGDPSEFTQHDSDNDGLWTAMYGAGECFAWAATRDPAARRRADAAFEALRFLSTVTQGGKPPAPPGFIARTVLPASAGDPNASAYTREKDQQFRATRDPHWKILAPRWPLSADGQWYWKADTSSDELDGHYFFYGVYYDLAAGEAERRRVRELVSALTGHLLDHNFTLVDWDGTPTRWGVFNPEALNRDPVWYAERGLNSLSILTYLKIAEHITGETRFGEAYRRLIREHGYAANTLVPKIANGIGSGNQSDDEMAFMDYYNLLRLERDPELLRIYRASLARYWREERYEMNPLFNYIYAAASGLKGGAWVGESLETLQRYPLDRFNWKHVNSYRTDVAPLPETVRGDRRGRAGMRRNGFVIPIDERFVDHWNHDPYQLDQGGDGRLLADGASFLLPYYLGLYHGFVEP